MNIRPANKFDLPYFIKLIREIHKKGEIGNFDIELDDDYLNALFMTCLHGGGVVFVAESDSVIGIILGIITPNLWSDKLLIMSEMLLYVDEEYRQTRAGYLLIKEYTKHCKELKKQNRIKYYTLNPAKNMFEFDFSRFGYEISANTWINSEN